MKNTFKSFAAKQVLLEGGDYGITHLEDLDVEAFVRFLEKLPELDAVQKLDGANLRVGVDDNGELFTSREQKGGRRFYAESDFPKNSAYDGFKAAHVVLEKAQGYILDVLNPGETINLEIIFGPQPNTVFYGKDNLNYIALLEMLPGDDPSIEPDQGKIKQLLELVKKKIFVVRTPFNDTTDGVQMMRAPRVTEWKFIKSDIVPKAEIQKVDYRPELGKLKSFLNQENQLAKKFGRDLTNFELIKDKDRQLSEEKARIIEKVKEEYIKPIKDKLLELVYQQKPSIRGEVNDDGAYKGIEGIIFTDPKTREKFKIVDKDVFSAINKFNYQTRKSIATRITTIDPEMPIESRGGIVGEARIRASALFGLDAQLPQQVKKTIEKFKGEDRSDTLMMMAKSLNQLNFQAIKRKIQAIYISALDDLEDSLTSFKMNADDYKLELKNGEVIKYTAEIKRRTLMVFAEARRQLIETVNRVRKADDLQDLLEIFYGAQLDQLYGEEDE